MIKYRQAKGLDIEEGKVEELEKVEEQLGSRKREF